MIKPHAIMNRLPWKTMNYIYKTRETVYDTNVTISSIISYPAGTRK